MSRHMEAEKPLVAARQHGLKCLDMWLTTGLMTITNIFQISDIRQEVQRIVKFDQAIQYMYVRGLTF